MQNGNCVHYGCSEVGGGVHPNVTQQPVLAVPALQHLLARHHRIEQRQRTFIITHTMLVTHPLQRALLGPSQGAVSPTALGRALGTARDHRQPGGPEHPGGPGRTGWSRLVPVGPGWSRVVPCGPERGWQSALIMHA